MRVGEPDLTELIRSLRLVHLDPGALLYDDGRIPAGVSIIRAGLVELSQGVGAHRRVVALLRSADVLGDVALLQNSPPPFTARTVTKATLWFLPARDFRRLVATYPSLAVGWLCSLAARLTRSRTIVADILDSDLSARVARLLIRESTNGMLDVPQATIARMLGAQRSSVNRVLNQFERDGIVTLGYSRIIIDDGVALEAVSRPDRVSAPRLLAAAR